MRTKLSAVLISLVLCVLVPGMTLAETTFDGTVVSSETIGVTAPFGGTVSSSRLRAGDSINVGDVIATVQTTKVYAPTAGVITGVFGQPGDAVEDVVSRIGAVLYILPASKYSITADIQYAYNNSDNKYVHIGETVYIYSYSASYDHSAVGTITAASGTTYTVETTEGELLMGETVSIFRESDYASSSRIGRGTVSRTAEVSVPASSGTSSGSTSSGSAGSSSSENSILYMYVQDGDTVERGQLLYETVTGMLDGLYATSNEIVSEESGVVASVSVTTGASISKGDTLITLYPRDRMQIELEIDEYDLGDLKEGDQLNLSFNYDDTEDTACVGTVAMISHVSDSTDTSDVTYKVYVDFTPNDDVRLGMTVVATPLTAAAADTDAAAAAATEAPAQTVDEAVGN